MNRSCRYISTRLNSIFCLHLGLMLPYVFFRPCVLHTHLLSILSLNTPRAGTAIIPIGVTVPLGSLIAGFVTSRTGRYRYSLRIAPLLLFLGGMDDSGLDGNVVAFTSAVKIAEQALVTSLSYVFRSTGSVIGVAIGSTVHQGVFGHGLWIRIHDVDDAVDIIRNNKDSLNEVDQLPLHLQASGGQLYDSLRAASLIIVGLAVVRGDGWAFGQGLEALLLLCLEARMLLWWKEMVARSLLKV